MSISEAEAYIENMVEKNKQNLVTINNDKQTVPDVRTCLQFKEVADDPNSDFWVYRIGYLSQPSTSVPDFKVPFVSRETGLEFLKQDEKLQVVNENVGSITGYDGDFVDSIIADIESGKFTLIRVQ